MAKKIKVSRFDTVQQPSIGDKKKYIVIVLSVVLVLGGFALGRKTAPESTIRANVQRSTSVSEVKTGAGPFNTKGIVPKDYEKSTEGAIAAASSYVSISTRLILLKDNAFNKATSEMASTEYATTLNSGINATRLVAQGVFKEDPNAFYREFPMGYFVVAADEEEVTVNVWSQVMLVAKPNFDGNTESKVHSITLVWERGDWKISNWTSAPGPTPRWQASNELLSVEDFVAAVSPFTGGYDYAPSF